MRLLSRKDLKERGIPFTNKHLIDLEKQGKFPLRIHIGANTVAWLESEVDEFVEKLAQARRPHD